MKKFILLTILLSVAISARAKEIPLPRPNLRNGKPLMQCFANRRSMRSFDTKELPPQMVGEILFAADGVTRDNGRKTVPTARNKQNQSVYAFTKDGVYRYNSAKHSLIPVLQGDFRKHCGTQSFHAQAPLVLVFVSFMPAVGNTPELQSLYAGNHSGSASQNVYLYAASNGLSTVVCGMLDRNKLHKLLKLSKDHMVIFSQPIGFPKNQETQTAVAAPVPAPEVKALPSSKVTLAELKKAASDLAQEPPRFAVTPKREAFLYKMDELLKEADSERIDSFGIFYRQQVDRVIKEVAAYKGATPRFWKLYSSGFIIKDKMRTIAVDINPGCVPGFGRTALRISSEQTKKLADIIDAYFSTHSHEDHIHPELCDELAKRKKLIVMPSEAIFRWTIRGATPSETFRSSYCKTYLNWQGVDSKKGLDNSMYFFTLSNGKTVFVRGDIYHGSGFELCLKNIAKWSSKIDYAFVTPYFTSGTDPVWTLNTKYNCRFIPIHEWEFSHRPSGVRKKATQDFHELYQAFDVPYKNGRAQFLFWGESIDLD